MVRERLCELELPHVLVSCARGSPKRQQLYERRGHFQVPYLEARPPLRACPAWPKGLGRAAAASGPPFLAPPASTASPHAHRAAPRGAPPQDPNGEGVAMFESAAILAYLEDTYAQQGK